MILLCFFKSTKQSELFYDKMRLIIQTIVYICNPITEFSNLTIAGVVELVDTLDLGSSAARCGSSSLPARTTNREASVKTGAFFYGNVGKSNLNA